MAGTMIVPRAGTPYEVDSTGKIADGPLLVSAIILSAGADAASAVLRDSTDGSGDAVITVKAIATDTNPVPLPNPILFHTAIHATLTGTSPILDVITVPNN